MAKIENIAVRMTQKTKRRDFWETLSRLEIGQSFTDAKVDSNVRNGISIAEILLNREFVTGKEGAVFRIGRIA